MGLSRSDASQVYTVQSCLKKKKIFKHIGGRDDVFLALFFSVEELVFSSLRRKGSLEKLKLNGSAALLLRHFSSCYYLWGCGLFRPPGC